METEENHYIYRCPTCGQRNRIRSPSVQGIKWVCGSCKSRILYRESKFHESLILGCRRDLNLLYISISTIKPSFFNGNEIQTIANQLLQTKSRLQNWEDHVEFLPNEVERNTIKRSYQPDLLEIKKISENISNEIIAKEWLKRKLEMYPSVRITLRSFSGVLSLVANVLTVLGIPNGLHGLADQIKQNLLHE